MRLYLADITWSGGIHELPYYQDDEEPPALESDYPPIIVARRQSPGCNGERYQLLDGFHRTAAAIGSGIEILSAVVATDAERDLMRHCGDDEMDAWVEAVLARAGE